MLLPPLRSRPGLALLLLVLGKVLGLVALLLGSVHRPTGVVLLALAAVCIVAAIVLCLDAMRRRSEDT